MTIKRIANNAGGVAPGLDAAIHTTVHAAGSQGWEISGIAEEGARRIATTQGREFKKELRKGAE